MSAGSDGLPERLTGRLERLGLRPDEASRRAGLPPDALDRMVAGAAGLPRGAKLTRLAEVLGCSISYLIGLEPDAPPPAEMLEEDQGSFGTLTPDQDALLRAYGRLDVLSKQALLRVAQRMAGPEPEAPPVRVRKRR